MVNGAIRALAKAKVCGAKVTGLADGTDLETTARSAGGGQVTRQRRLADRRGREPEIEITVDGWKVLVFCQLVESDIVTRQTGTLPRCSLPLRQPAPYP